MALLLTLARLDIFRQQKTQQMFLTNSSASVLSDDIGNRGTFHKTHNCLLFGSLALWLLWSLQLMHMRLLGVHVTTITHVTPAQ